MKENEYQKTGLTPPLVGRDQKNQLVQASIAWGQRHCLSFEQVWQALKPATPVLY
ncbi:MAG: hypothetical protein WC508_02765 [Patescibacteria group bacterium]